MNLHDATKSIEEKLYKYFELLVEWNNRFNMTSILEEKENNKEEKKGGTFTSLFSRNKKNDTYNQKESFFNSTDEKSSQTKDHPQLKPDTNNTPHSTATESQEQKSKDRKEQR